LSRALIAYFWRTTPAALRRIPIRELRVMGEAMRRIHKAREEEAERIKQGAPTPRGGARR
jgi:hypothetical protein